MLNLELKLFLYYIIHIITILYNCLLHRIIIVIISDNAASFFITILILDSLSTCDPQRLIISRVPPLEGTKRIQPA